MLRFSADEGFWDAACERYWHREPFAFAVDADAAPFDEAGVFAALIAPGDRDPLDWLQVAEGSNPAQLRDYRLGTVKRFGPQSADGDFAGQACVTRLAASPTRTCTLATPASLRRAAALSARA